MFLQGLIWPPEQDRAPGLECPHMEKWAHCWTFFVVTQFQMANVAVVSYEVWHFYFSWMHVIGMHLYFTSWDGVSYVIEMFIDFIHRGQDLFYIT